MKQVLIITYYWPPAGGAGVQRWLKFAKYLPEYGWRPIVLTVNPNRATYPVRDESLLADVSESTSVYYTETSELFGLYSRVQGKKQVPYGGFANEGRPGLKEKISRFIRGNIFIPDPRKGWNKYAYRKAVELIAEFNIQTVITTGPPHSTQLIGLQLKKNLGINWMADFRDPWTDIYYYKMFYPTIIARTVDAGLEKRVVQTADKILTVGYSLKRLLDSKYSLPEDKIIVLTNGYDSADFENMPQTLPNRFTITYVGTLAETYPIKSVIQALKEFEREGNDFLLRFVGPVAAVHRESLTCLKPGNIEFLPYQPHGKAIEFMMESSVLLLVIPEYADNKSIVTGKLFEYIATGNRILGIGPVDGDMAIIVNECNAGCVAAYDDKLTIKTLIQQFANTTRPEVALSSNSSVKEFSRQEITRKLAHLLDEYNTRFEVK
jgi:glycosyltransferase involved in cell wall biosynthesis